MCRKRTDEKGKTLRKGIMHKSGGLYQVEVRPGHWRKSWKLHFGTYATEGEAHVARDLCTFLRVLNEEESKAGGYHFSESEKIFDEFERAQDHPVRDLFRKVCDNCANNLPSSTYSAGAVSPGKSKSSGPKDPDLKLLNQKARDGIKEMMGKFKEFYPSEFETSTGISEIFKDEAETRGNQVQTIHPSYTGAPSLRDIVPEELLTNEDWNKPGELQKIKGDKYILSEVEQRDHNGYHNPQEGTLFPAQQKLSNQAFPYLDEVLKEPLPTANMDPKGIDVIDSELVFDSNDDFVNSLYDSSHISDDFVNSLHDSLQWDYTKELD